MPTGTLTFELPDESIEFRIAAYAGDLYSGVYDYADWLAKEVGASNLSPAELQVYAKARTAFWSYVMARLPDDIRD
jgi:hypothetical protein